MTLKALKEQLVYMEEWDMNNEMSDNFYYTSGRKAEAVLRMRGLKKQIKEMEGK